MKRMLKFGCMLLFFLINAIVVEAQSVSIVCPKSVKPGNKFSCSINASYKGEYGGIEGIISYSDGLTYNGFTSSFSNGEIYNNKLSVYDVDLKKGASKIGTVSFTLSKNAKDSQKISLSNLIIFDADSIGINSGDASSSIKIDTSNNKSSSASSGNGGNASSGSGTGGNIIYSSKIKTLVINNGDIAFNKDITEYEITVPASVTKLDIDITLETSSSKYSISGNENFQVGENLVEITVSPKSGSVTVYKIKVNRLAQSSNSLLESLKITDYKIDFDSNKFKYNLYIDSGVDNLEIEALAVDNQALVVIGGNSELKTGSIISIIVEAEDGTSSMYILRIINRTSLIYLGIGVTILLLVIMVIIMIYLKKRKNNNQIFMDLNP